MKKVIHRDVWVGIFLLVLCSVILYFAFKIPGEASYLPVALTSLMMLCGVVVLIKGIRFTKQQNTDAFKYNMTVKGGKNALIYMLFIAAYYVLFRYVSYWVATPLFLFFSMKHLKIKSWKGNLIITASYLIICYIIFVVILKLPIYRIGVLGKYFRFS